MLGFLDVVTILLTLGNFGVDKNPAAPSAAEVIKYAPAEADLMIYADLQAVVPKNYKALQALAKDPKIAKSPRLSEVLLEITRNVEMGRGMAQSMLGFDPIDDVESLAIWLRMKKEGEPEVLVVVRGKFTPGLFDQAAKMAGLPTTKIDGRTSIAQGGMMAGVGADSAIILGTEALVRPRLGKWKPAVPANKKLAKQASAVFRSKPFFAAISTPSEEAVQFVGKELGNADNVLVDMVENHSFGALYFLHNGVGWSVTAKTKSGYERALQASEGVLELFRAGQYGIRGLAHVFFAGLDSYKGANDSYDQMLAHKKELMKLVEALSGDGKFKARVNKSAAQKTVTVVASGKKLSDVVPLAGVLPLAGAALLWRQVSEPAPEESVAIESSPAEPANSNEAPAEMGRLDVRDTYRRAKAQAWR